MSSDNSPVVRRVPKQERAENRLRMMLAAAESLIDERGLEAVTMTEIAVRAQMSIGALYQYFPNKDAIATAMRTAYAQEMDRLWSEFVAQGQGQPLKDFTDGVVELMVGFIGRHPAYLQLFSAAVRSRRSEAEREGLRARFADAFAQRRADLTQAQAMHMGETALAIVKSLVGLHARARPGERRALVEEMKFALHAYLEKRLAPGEPHS